MHRRLLLGLIVMISIAAAACGSPGPTRPSVPVSSVPVSRPAPPSPMATIAATTSPSTSSPSPTPAIPGIPVEPLPPDAVRRILLPETPAGPIAGAGRYLYFATSDPSHPGFPVRLWVADTGAGTLRRTPALPGGLAAGQRIGRVEGDGSWVAILTWRGLGPAGQPGAPCSTDSGQPIEWRLLSGRSEGDVIVGAKVATDTGVSRLVFRPVDVGEYCDGPLLPRVAVSAGRVAYAIEDVSASRPAGARILIRRIVDGRIVREIRTAGQIVSLALSATSVAWSESDNVHSGGSGSWSVRRAALSDGVSHGVALGAPTAAFYGAPSVALDGEVVVANPIRLDGRQVVLRSAANGQAQVITPPDVSCFAAGVASGRIVLQCASQAGGPGVVQFATVVWTAAGGLRAVDGVDQGSLVGGYLIWFEPDPLAASGERLALLPVATLGP